MHHHSFKTQLSDRVLWYDGECTYPSDNLLKLINVVDVKYVDRITRDIEIYNNNIGTDQQITVKQSCNNLSYGWNIPEEYKQLDIVRYVSDAHANLNVEDRDKREYRLAQEITLYNKYNLYDVLRVIIYIINTLTSANIVWGVGRGSSVSSYLLYIIGVHDVDSYLYQLDITDFLHD